MGGWKFQVSASLLLISIFQVSGSPWRDGFCPVICFRPFQAFQHIQVSLLFEIFYVAMQEIICVLPFLTRNGRNEFICTKRAILTFWELQELKFKVQIQHSPVSHMEKSGQPGAQRAVVRIFHRVQACKIPKRRWSNFSPPRGLSGKYQAVDRGHQPLYICFQKYLIWKSILRSG